MGQKSDQNEQCRRMATECFLKHCGLIRLVAFETAPSTDLTNDIANDTFVYFIERADRWDYARDLTPLLRKITRNMAMRHWREHLKNLPQSLAPLYEFLRTEPSSEEKSDEQYDYERQMAALELCLKKLASPYLSLVEAHYFGGLKLVQIAEETHTKLGTLQKKMCRIRAALRTCIDHSLAGGTLHVE